MSKPKPMRIPESNRPDEGYTPYKHRHNFAVWAAARAAQRGFTTVDNLRAALEETDIESFVKQPCGAEEFDDCHRRWCNRIRDYLRENDVAASTYGRAAKLVNVYLKTMLVLPDLGGEHASYIHPPVDRILLKNIVADSTLPLEHRRALDNINWTELDEKGYFRVINVLWEISDGQPFWRIERYWT